MNIRTLIESSTPPEEIITEYADVSTLNSIKMSDITSVVNKYLGRNNVKRIETQDSQNSIRVSIEMRFSSDNYALKQDALRKAEVISQDFRTFEGVDSTSMSDFIGNRFSITIHLRK